MQNVPINAETFFYQNSGDGRFVATSATAGPWSPRFQHGGPPSALLGRAVERHALGCGLRVARVTVEIPRPVPVGEVEIEVHDVHSGSRTRLVDATMTAGGRTVVLVRAWLVARSPAATPVLRPEPTPVPLPGPMPQPGMSGAHVDGYVSAIEWRFTDGDGFDARGPGSAWARQRGPLVRGEADTPLTRVLTLADSSWAVGFELDHTRDLIVNTDVTVALHRDPVGEWLFLRSTTAASPNGSGLAVGYVGDADGDCGRVLQTLLVAER